MEHNEQNYEFMLKVKDEYEKLKEKGENSIRSVAVKLGLSRTKVRKILVTLGVIKSEITETAKKLKAQGLSLNEIADEMGVSIATVSTYLPYDTVIYNGEVKSANALRIDKYRERLKNVADTQIHHSVKTIPDEGRNTDMKKREYKVYKLRLELDTEGADYEVLKKYGKVKDSITREVLVPADITLHALHYVIQRLFGWQNSHLHHFELPEPVYQEMTGNSFRKWSDYCGIYFRFPSDDMDDIYWDDDYNGDVSVKTWFRRKYTGLYQYRGMSEHFMEARYALSQFLCENKEISVAPPFSEWQHMSDTERLTQKAKNIDEVSCEEIALCFESGGIEELLERLRVSELLSDDASASDMSALIKEAHRRYSSNLPEFIELHNSLSDDNEYEYWHRMSEIDSKAVPLTKELIYKYDYGDDWTVKITLVDQYYSDDAWDHPKNGWITPAITDEQVFDDQTPMYKDGEVIDGELKEQICSVISNYRPLCVAADGLPVLDDVGGIGGFCGMLLGLHGKDCGGYPFEDAEETKEWASGMGWTGKMSKPEKML